MAPMKVIGKFGLLLGMILSTLVGLNTLNYLWLLPIITFQTLSYYLVHFKNFKFKKIGKRNNPFTKELPRHLIIQALVIFMCFSLGLGLDIFFKHEAYASLLGQITQFFDLIHFALDAVKQAMTEIYNAVLQSRFN
jgi:hypothetical protein